MAMSPAGLGTKNYAGEGQQQFTGPDTVSTSDYIASNGRMTSE
jgi:hypothetical protein